MHCLTRLHSIATARSLFNRTPVSAIQFLTQKIQDKYANIEKLEQGKGLEIHWADGQKSRFHSSWLRMNCQCSQCFQDHSGQRVVDVSRFPKHLTIADLNISGNSDEVTVLWDHEKDHKSLFKLDWLKEHSYSKEDIENQSILRKFAPFRGSVPEAVSYKDVLETNEGLLKWLQLINEHGIALVNEVPSEEDAINNVAERMGPVLRMIYGTVFHVRSTPKPINIAYSNANLPLHMDLSYYQSPPGIQFLHCLRFDKEVTGGDSIFLDVFAVAEKFRETNPEEFETLSRVPATFQKIHFERDYPVYLKYQRPHITLNHRKEIVSVTWSPAFEGPLFVDEEDVEPYYQGYRAFDKAIHQSDLKLTFKLNEGEIATFNNIRVLHGRDEFEMNGGSRHFQGCYVNIDEFRNKVDVMAQLYGDKRVSKRVGNNCFF